MSDIESLVQETEALCRAVARRDLEGVPLYVVPQSSIAHEWGTGVAVEGFTNPCLDLLLQHRIPDYRGRGPCMVVNDMHLEPIDLDYVFKATALHELAHILERPKLFSDLPPHPPEGTDADWLARASAVVAAAINDAQIIERPDVNVHGLDFMRIAIHLCHRASRYGHRVSPAAVACRHEGTSGPWVYEMALDDEPERRVNDAFRDILSSAPPPEFVALWERDQRAIQKRRKAAQEAARRESQVECGLAT